VNQMINELGREDVYILIFLIVAVLAGIGIVVIFIRGLARQTKREEDSVSFQGAPPIDSSPYPSHRASAESAAADVVFARELSELPSIDQADLEVGRQLNEVAKTTHDAGSADRIHTLQEIQRAEPKKLSSALVNTRSSFFGRIKNLFGTKSALSANEMDELEEILYTSDLGPQTVQRLLDAVQVRIKSEGATGFEAVRSALKTEMLQIFTGLDSGLSDGSAHLEKKGEAPNLRVVRPNVHRGSERYVAGLEELAIWDHKPAVLMVVGVNGAGKTTTIGKLASRLAQSGRKVLVAAGDTFRAAAGDQLKIWTERAQVTIYSPEGVSDPSAVAFKACEIAQTEGYDVVIIDTAGRLHTQKNLMEELKKMKRVIQKPVPSGPHEVLLVLDANSGQNALIQAREFNQALGVTGVVLTKLDGTAKGGVALGLAFELHLAIKLIGIGEGIDDLRRFSACEFVDSII